MSFLSRDRRCHADIAALPATDSQSLAARLHQDLSLHMLIVLTAGLALWTVYGMPKADYVIVAANGIAVLWQVAC